VPFFTSVPAFADDKPVEVDVVGTKEAETGGSVHTIKRKQLDRFKYDDPTVVFREVPGVYARGEDGYGLRPNIGIRGGNSDRSKKVTLMQDGVLFGPAPYSAPAAYYFPVIGRMRAVRLVKGPSAIVYGPQTVGGAIDLVTEDVPTTPRSTWDLGLGSYGYTKILGLAGLSSENLGVLIQGINLGSTGFKRLDGGGDTGFVKRELMGKVLWTLPSNARVQQEIGVALTWSSEVSNETYLGLTDQDFRATPYRRYLASRMDRMELHRVSTVVSHHAHFASDVDLVTTAYRHDYHRIWRKVNGFRGADIANVLAHPEAPANSHFYRLLTGEQSAADASEAILIGPNDRTFVSQGVQSVARWTAKNEWFENRLEYGIRLHYDEIRRKHTQDGFLMQNGQLVPDGRSTETTADNTASTTALALYLADSIAFERLIVTPGVRLEIIRSRFEDRLGKAGGGGEESGALGSSIGTEQVILPGVGSYLSLYRGLGLVAGVHRGFSPPPPGSSSVTRAEDSINWEGGARYSSRRIRAEVLGFFNDYRNLTDVCTFSNGCLGASEDRQYDAGAVHVYGVEAFAASDIATNVGVTIPVRISYTFTRSKFLSSFVSSDPQFGDVHEGDELPYVPRHQLSAMIGVENKRFGVAGQVLYVSRMRESAGQGPFVDASTTDAQTIFDVSAWVRVLEGVGVYANGRNLTDQAYLAGRRPFGARPGAPRTFQIGLRVEL
jgi:Fe(3+) dicitrate transport protein